MPRVMLVDGYPSVRKLYSLHLKAYGLEVVDTPTFAEALVFLQTNFQFDAIFVNINFYEHTGLRFIESVRQRCRAIPVVAILQIVVEDNTVKELMRRGAHACLISPILKKDFYPVLAQLGLNDAPSQA